MTRLSIHQAMELAMQQQRVGDVVAAEAICRQILQQFPEQAEALHLLGVLRLSQGDARGAAELIERAAVLAPRAAEYRNNLGVVMQALNRKPEAETQFRHAVALSPNYAEALNNLGAILCEQGELTEAIELNRKATELRPGYGDAYANLGNALIRLGRIDEATDALRTGLKAQPDHMTMNSNLLVAMQYQTMLSPQQRLEAHVRWGRRLEDLAGKVAAHTNDRDPNRRLRIGYVSQDFREHSVSYFCLPALKGHDREQVEVFCYAQVGRGDRMTELSRRHADVWRDVSNLPPPRLAMLIRDDAVDILVDLGGHTAPALLSTFAMKPAPVQVSYLGYPHTTGLSRIDYRITDSLADPVGQADELSTERLIRVDPCAWCYHPIADAPPVSPPPSVSGGPITFGTFNALAKINPSLIQLWARVLRAVPDSRLLMKAGALKEEPARERLRGMFAQHDIDPQRLELKGHVREPRAHLAMYERVDVALDTFPYHGTTTTCEALWMGVPVITLSGDMHASRVGVSLLTNAGLTELIAANENQYVERAALQAGDRSRLAALRSTMRQRLMQSPLRDERSLAARLERAYRAMWQKWCAS